MKKRFLFLLIVVCLLAITSTLVSCRIVGGDVKTIAIKEGSPTEIAVGSLNFADFTLVVTREDDSVEEITLDSSMITPEEMLKTYRDGEQKIKVTYQEVTCDLVVTVKRFAFEGLTLPDQTFTYSGECFSLDVAGPLPEGTLITYPTGNSYKNAGTYYITAVLANDLYITQTITGKLTIQKTKYDMSDIEFKDAAFAYDGTPKSLSVSAKSGTMPADLSVSYSIGKAETNSMTDASDTPYTVVAHFDAGANYLPIDNMTAKLTIVKGRYDMSPYTFKDGEFTYDGKAHAITIANEANLPEGVTVRYTCGEKTLDGNVQTLAGVYTITAIFSGDSTNYEPIKSLSATMNIKKAEYTLKNITMEGASYVYDKVPHTITYTLDEYDVLPAGVTFLGYEYYLAEQNINTKADDDYVYTLLPSAPSEVGLYEVRAKFIYNNPNFKEITPVTAMLEITKADITGIVFDNLVCEWDGDSHAIVASNYPTGVTVTYENNVQSEIGQYIALARFTLSDSMAKNYNPIADLQATINITKATFDTKEFWYVSGSDKAVKESPVFDSQKTYTLSMRDSQGAPVSIDGISIYLTYINDEGTEVAFKGTSLPCSMVVFASFSIQDGYYKDSGYTYKDYYKSHFDLEQEEEFKYNGTKLLRVAKKSVAFSIKRMAITPIWKDKNGATPKDESVSLCWKYTSAYNVGGIEVVLDEAKMSEKYSGIAFRSVSYDNNKKAQGITGFFTGTCEIELTDDANKLYYFEDDLVTFYYGILPQDGKSKDLEYVEYDPNLQGYTTDYEEGKQYKVSIKKALPFGIQVEYVYPKEMNKPGRYLVTAVFTFTDAVAESYYKLPDDYTPNAAETAFEKIVAITVEKKLYDINYSANFVFKDTEDGPKTYIPSVVSDTVRDYVTGLTVTNWFNVTYKVWEDDKWTDFTGASEPGTYRLKAMPKINGDKTNLNAYYRVAEKEFDLVIEKARVTAYSINGQVIKYDGKAHDISILGLPKGISAVTNLQGGVKSVGKYDVTITFGFDDNENGILASQRYKKPDNIKTAIIIENNLVELSKLDAFCKDESAKAVSQFYSIKNLLTEKVELNDIDSIDWTCTYYRADGETPYDASDATRHKKGGKTDDFMFAYATLSGEFVRCNFIFELSEGYVFDMTTGSTSYENAFVFTVVPSEEIDIFDLVKCNKETEISQGTSVREAITRYVDEKYLGCFTLEFVADYYDGLAKYPAEMSGYHGSSANGADFILAYNTWGTRYCKVSYTLTAKLGYGFTLGQGGEKYFTYSDVATYYVDSEITSLNISDLEEYFGDSSVAEIGQYSRLEDLLNRMIPLDTYYKGCGYDISLSLKIDGTPVDVTALSYIFGEASNDVELGIKISCDAGYGFKDKQVSVYEGTKSLRVISMNVIDTTYFKTLENEMTADNHSHVIGQYLMLFDELFSNPAVLTGIKSYHWHIYKDNGSNYIDIDEGSMDKDFWLTYVWNKEDGYFVEITLQADDGYIFVDKGIGYDEISLRYTIATKAAKLVDRKAWQWLEDEYQGVSIPQYSDLTEVLKETIDYLNDTYKDNDGNNAISIKWSVDLVNAEGNTTKSIATEGTEKVVFDEMPDGEKYRVTLYMTLDRDKSDYIFSALDERTMFAINVVGILIPTARTAINVEDIYTKLDESSSEVYQYTYLNTFYNSFKFDSRVTIKGWSVKYLYKMGYTQDDWFETLDTGDTSFYFEFDTTGSECTIGGISYIDQYAITLTLACPESCCMKNKDGFYRNTIDVSFVINAKKTTCIKVSGLNDTIDNGITASCKEYTRDSLFEKLFGISQDSSSNGLTESITIWVSKYKLPQMTEETSMKVTDGNFDYVSTTNNGYLFEMKYVLKLKEGVAVIDEGGMAHIGTYTVSGIKLKVLQAKILDYSSITDFWTNDSDNKPIIAKGGVLNGAKLREYLYFGMPEDSHLSLYSLLVKSTILGDVVNWKADYVGEIDELLLSDKVYVPKNTFSDTTGYWCIKATFVTTDGYVLDSDLSCSKEIIPETWKTFYYDTALVSDTFENLNGGVTAVVKGNYGVLATKMTTYSTDLVYEVKLNKKRSNGSSVSGTYIANYSAGDPYTLKSDMKPSNLTDYLDVTTDGDYYDVSICVSYKKNTKAVTFRDGDLLAYKKYECRFKLYVYPKTTAPVDTTQTDFSVLSFSNSREYVLGADKEIGIMNLKNKSTSLLQLLPVYIMAKAKFKVYLMNDIKKTSKLVADITYDGVCLSNNGELISDYVFDQEPTVCQSTDYYNTNCYYYVEMSFELISRDSASSLDTKGFNSIKLRDTSATYTTTNNSFNFMVAIL